MKDNMKEMKENPIGNIKNGRTLSYDIVNQIERKARQIERRCCRLSYETGKLKNYNVKSNEKPCTVHVSLFPMFHILKLHLRHLFTLMFTLYKHSRVHIHIA